MSDPEKPATETAAVPEQLAHLQNDEGDPGRILHGRVLEEQVRAEILKIAAEVEHELEDASDPGRIHPGPVEEAPADQKPA